MFDIIQDLLKDKPRVNLVDVGCHKGHFIQRLRNAWPKEVRSIGIDPINYCITDFDVYVCKAVDNVDRETTRGFYQYIEPGCNSLLQMMTKSVVHERGLPGWYVGWEIETNESHIEVLCDSLENILNGNNIFGDEIIDYLKIDTQGNDVNVVRSLRSWINRVRYVQIESVSSHNPKNTLYYGQTLMEDDIKTMAKLGFDVIFTQDYSKEASPEADVIFKNGNI